MSVNRRQFIAGAAVAAVMAGCDREAAPQPPNATRNPADGSAGAATTHPSPQPATQPTTRSAGEVANAGPVADFDADRVYDAFRSDGFFVIRRDGKLFALSSVCTHRACKVSAQPDTSFVCRCHGSNFSPDGKVLNGPATRDLPRLPVATDAQGNLLVKLA